MSAPSISTPKKIDFTYKYNGQSIDYSIWSTAVTSEVETVVFLGTVQIGNAASWVAEDCPPNTIVVQGAPHWFAKDDGSDIPDFMFDFTKDAFINILGIFHIRNVHVIAESQAVPGVVRLFALDKYRAFLRDIVLLQPIGLNQQAFSGDEKSRIHTFKRRIAHNAQHQLLSLLSDSRLRYSHRIFMKEVDFRDAKSRAQYDSGLLYNAVPDITKLYETNQRIAIVCGADDKIFPPSEIRDTLEQHRLDIQLHIVPMCLTHHWQPGKARNYSNKLLRLGHSHATS